MLILMSQHFNIFDVRKRQNIIKLYINVIYNGIAYIEIISIDILY